MDISHSNIENSTENYKLWQKFGFGSNKLGCGMEKLYLDLQHKYGKSCEVFPKITCAICAILFSKYVNKSELKEKH